MCLCLGLSGPGRFGAFSLVAHVVGRGEVVTTDEVVVVARSIVEYRLLGDRAAGVFVLTPRLWKRRATVMSARPLGCLLPLPNSQYDAIPAARYVGKQPFSSRTAKAAAARRGANEEAVRARARLQIFSRRAGMI